MSVAEPVDPSPAIFGSETGSMASTAPGRSLHKAASTINETAPPYTSSTNSNNMTAFPFNVDPSALQTSSKILEIIDRYRMVKSESIGSKSDDSVLNFLALAYNHVRAGRPVPMCLPAFPFKSPNSLHKVLGKLPDKAEEFALARLNGLCQAIGDVYSPGAKLTIISDGLVYNDLLGVPDRDVWAYGEALRELAVAKGFSHISFSRLRDLVHIELPSQLNEMTYVANASNFRRALLNTFSKSDWSWEEARKSEDACLTYRGYIKFLELDLENVYPVGEDRTKSKYKKGIEYIAKQMMARGDVFANAVRQKYPDHLRLSIHPSTGETKLSISLLPTDTTYTTPWHSAIVFKLDGTTTTGPRIAFEKDTRLELVYENGRPSYYREKSDLLSWGEGKGGIVCDPIYPAGLAIRPAQGRGTLTMDDIDTKKVRALSEINSPVILRGFVKKPEKDTFIKKSYHFGTPLPWKFGLLLEVKDRGVDTRGLNNVLSAEWMPYHYDGLFKTVKKVDESTGEEILVSTPPHFQLFHTPTASPSDTGFTLFASSTLVFKYLPSWLTVEKLSEMTWTVSTSSFDSTILKGLPLVINHPTTGKPCLRYHEPWPQSRTKFDATSVTVDDSPDSSLICDTLNSLLHDRRVAFYHVWEKGDLLVSDNVLMMHTRSDFTSGSDRELWRIHFD